DYYCQVWDITSGVLF
nr:immunoglobulin light chain junction region [Macaca mulatta]